MNRKPGVHGAKDIQRAFREMAKLYGRPVNAAMRHAMGPMLRAARKNTPHKRVKKALVLKQDRKAPKTQPAMMIGGDPKNPDYRLLHLLEFGTDPHPVNHPGTDPQPFLTPAFTAEGPAAIRRFGERLGPEIEKQAARLAKKRGGA